MSTIVNLTNPIFTDLDKAREHFEAIRWPDGTYCPFCGTFDRVAALGGKSMGAGWYHCKDCRRKFTAAVGTIYERSHIPMTKWLLATHLMCASKKGMSAHQLHRMIGLPYKTAWFMAHRIREGMRDLAPASPLGGEGKVVEIDETYVGGKEKNKHRNKCSASNIGSTGKEIAFSLVERGEVHTNTIEGYFSILKRGIIGTYHHVSQQHLKRYLAEFDFRYNERSALNVTDLERATKAVKGVVGKRVIYQGTNNSYPKMAH